MGAVVSDILEQTGDLGGLWPIKAGRPLNHRYYGPDNYYNNYNKQQQRGGGGAAKIDAYPDRSRRRSRNGEQQQPPRLTMPACTKGHHRMCRPAATTTTRDKPQPDKNQIKTRRRPLTFGERLERIYELDDPTMVQRSSTPTGGHQYRMSNQFPTGEDEYGAWTAYLRTPGTFRGQMKPDLPGAFSGMCFPGSDPRWICHHQLKSQPQPLELPAVKNLIIVN